MSSREVKVVRGTKWFWESVKVAFRKYIIESFDLLRPQ